MDVTEKPPVKPVNDFTLYTIRKGNQFCDQDKFMPVQISQLNFIVRFDSTCIYTTQNPKNQGDINKLYGFSDNSSAHHDYSARFGWRWNKNEQSLQAYIYNDGKRSFTDLGIIEIGKEYKCSIAVEGDHYIFKVDDKLTAVPRASTSSIAVGYKLFPYFGGDEVAPHDINIYIKEE